MVVRVRPAMIVPHSVQGGANGCLIARHLQSSRDLFGQSAVAAMEKKSKGAAENGRQGAGHETVVAWQRATSESSISSMDGGEALFSPSDIPQSLLHRKARLAPNASESDDEAMLDPLQEDFLGNKTRRPFFGGGTGLPQPHSASSLNVDEDHGSTPSDDGKDQSSRVKFMCSFGGKIFPRPSDGKLRYVGGDTKIIAVNRDTNFLELMAKMTEVYGEALILKYQLPDEDLDALISVSSDEDLENMMEEYDKLERGDGSSRLRVFLFPAVDFDSVSHHPDATGDLRNSEQRYVDAVNGIPELGPRSSRMDSHVGSTQIFPMDNLLGLDLPETWSVPEPWNMPRDRDSVPVALAAPQVAHDVAPHLRVPVAVPVSNISSRSNVPSAPSSAPSSPPLLSRQAHGKLPIASDVHLQYHPDAHVKLGSQYNVLVAEPSFQDSEGYVGSAGSSGPGQQHDPLYRSSDSRRGPDSPPRKQYECGHPEHSMRVEQRRLSESMMPRVGSHGKLTRLGEHVDLAHGSDSQQLPDMLEMHRLLEQRQQQSLHQAVWQHPMDPQNESYRRADLLQSTITQNAMLGQQQQGYQQHQPVIFRPGLPPQGLPSHETGYRQGDQQHPYPEEVIHHMSRSGSAHTMAPGVQAVQSSSYHNVGSAPSSPRLGFREVASRHAQGAQQVPSHWAFGGSSFTEQQPSYGRRINYGDQSGRSFRLSNSPPKYRDRLVHADERLLRQQQQQALGNPETQHHEVPMSAQLLYESNPGPQAYDLLSRPQVPLYKGLNPFQEKLISYPDHQEIGDTRRHEVSQQGKDSQFLPGQQRMHGIHSNQRLDYHDPLLQQGDQLSGNPRYQDNQLKAPERELDEARLGFRGRRSGTFDDDLHVESVVPHQRELQHSSYPGIHLPDTIDDPVPAPAGDFTSFHSKGDRLDHPGSGGLPYRPGLLPPIALSGYSGPKPRTNLSDTAGVPRYIPRSHEPDYLAAERLLRGGGNVQEPRTSVYELNGHQQTSSGLGQGLQFPPAFHRLEDRPAGSAFTPINQTLQNLRPGDNISMGNDIRWNGGLGADDVRIDTSQGRDLLGNYYEDRLQNLAINRGSRLSRPSSSTNIPSLVEDERGDTAHLHPYGTQRISSSLIDEDAVNQYSSQSVPANETLLFASNATKYPNASPSVDLAPPTSSGLFAFDHTPSNSTSSDYIVMTKPDLPNIKTIATQVPSSEGDESGGSTSTTGASDHSKSNRKSGELFGQLTMTQHLAENVASCVLDPSPVNKSVSQAGQEDAPENVMGQDRSSWPLEPAPTLSPTLWENALHDAMVTNFQDGNNDENLEEEEDSTVEHAGTAASIAKDEEIERIFQEHLDFGSPESEKEKEVVDAESTVESNNEDNNVKNAADAAAAEAIAHGLQTIKNADLEELRELGSGTFGTVYHGKWRGTDVAIKRIKASCFAGRPSEQERLIADFWREACNLGNLHHPNVVAFYGVVSDGPGGTLATVTEYMVNGSLKQVLQKKDRTIDRRKRLLIAMDSAFGMEYLHEKNIVHFDLKCENLLVNMRDPHRPICKVGDLGLSKVKHQTMVSGGVRGTLPWMAPELLNGSSSMVSEKVDVFSFGIVMWELLTGEEPYANMHYGAIIGGIVNNTLRPPIPTWCDPGWRALMERCWSSDPTNRPSFSEIAAELRAMSEALKPKSGPLSQGQPPSGHA
ncbi:unnamed protein product [Calypogeia fissa]